MAFRLLCRIFLVLMCFFIAGCEETVSKAQYDKLKRQYDQLSKQYRTEVATLKNQLSDIESNNSELSDSLRQNINDRLATEEERQALIAEYRKVSLLLSEGRTEEAKVLSLQLTDTTLSELDVQIITLIQKSERLSHLESIFAEADLLVRSKTKSWIIKQLGDIFSVALVAFGLVATIAVTAVLITNFPDGYDRKLATAICCTIVIASFTSTATTQVPLILYLFSSIVGVDQSAISAHVPPIVSRLILETVIPILAGAYIGYLFNKARRSGSSENRDLLTVFVLSMIIASIVDAAVFYGVRGGTNLPAHSNFLFSISGLFSAAISRMKERPSLAEDTGALSQIRSRKRDSNQGS